MTKIVVILGFLLSLAAGIVIGARSRDAGLFPPAGANPTTGPSESKRDRTSFWTSELGLSPEQRTQLDGIWSEIAQRGRGEHDEKRRDFRRERDTSIADLVPPARMGDYDRIMDLYTDKLVTLERESRESYDAAVEKTKQILTPEQRARYDELLKRHQWGPGPSTRDRFPGRKAETRATSQPGRTDELSPSHAN